MKNKINVLYVHFGEDWIRGSERCLIDLVSHIDRDRFNVFVWCNSEVLANTLKTISVDTIRTDFTVLFGWSKPKLDFKNFSELTKISLNIIQNKKIDVIHANSGAPNQWLVMPSRIKRIPLITHLHSPYLLRDRLSLCLHHSNHIVGVSNAVTRNFIDDDGEKKNIGVIYNGIDVDRMLSVGRMARDLSSVKQKSCIRFTTVGSLIERKGIDRCIKMMKTLIALGCSCSLTIIGDGPLKADLELLAASMGVSGNVSFVGEQKDVFSWLKHCTDIVVSCPSEEAFGLTLAEAGLARLPVIATRVGGIPEVVLHKKTGILVGLGDHESLVKAAVELIENPAYRACLGNNGFKRVVKKFDIKDNRKKFEQLYVRVINETPTHSFRYLKKIFLNRFSPIRVNALAKLSQPSGGL